MRKVNRHNTTNRLNIKIIWLLYGPPSPPTNNNKLKSTLTFASNRATRPFTSTFTHCYHSDGAGQRTTIHMVFNKHNL